MSVRAGQDDRLPWMVRLLALVAATRMLVTGRHVYLSTGCMADRHDYCASMLGLNGEKTPGRSKFSGSACICPCHRPQPAGRQVRAFRGAAIVIIAVCLFFLACLVIAILIDARISW